jgi:aldehyde:ferredoxin oxidoreductase
MHISCALIFLSEKSRGYEDKTMNLYAGKVLVVDLTQKAIAAESLKEEWLKDYWGAWGLAVRYYWDLTSPDVDPLSPANPIVIMTGPFCGTLVPMTSRFCMVSKSPQTRTIFESNTGGAFAPELKFAGYDGIIVKGKAATPVYLKIHDGRVEIADATPLMGKGIFETEKLLKEPMGTAEAKTLAIGPAGENLVGYACVGTESYRQMGRAGGGALFGAKNLKGIVCRGSGGIQVADMKAFRNKIRRYKAENLMVDDNLWAKTDGTGVLMNAINELGGHPTHNFTFGVNEQIAAIDTDAIKAAKIADRACSSCPMACGKFTHINGAEVEGPEYETLCLGGSNCEINELEQIIRFNRLCDDLGLDTISCGNTIALAMEMEEKGRKRFGLRFGDPKGYLDVIHEIATLSTDRGRDLSLGARKLAEKYHALDMALEIKGLEFPAYEPRSNYGMGLAYATSERGACHMRAFPMFANDPFDLEALSRMVVDGQNFNCIKWSMCFCDFWATITPEIISDLLSTGLGDPVTPQQIVKSGEKIWNLIRLFNVQAGFGAKDDILPERIMSAPLGNGPHAGNMFKEEDFVKARGIYYKMRGWNEDGVPSREKLAELGLEKI